MAVDLVMPMFTETMTEGTIIAWLKKPGDQVAVGDDIVEIETDKASMVYQSDTAGTLLELLAKEGEMLPVGTAIARVGSPDEEAAEPRGGSDHPRLTEPRETQAADPDTRKSLIRSRANAHTRTAYREGPTDASPFARKLAEEKGVDLGTIAGSGPGGRITRRDVQEASTLQSPSPPSDRGEISHIDPTNEQRVAAERMAEAQRTIPLFHLSMTVTMDEALDLLARQKEEGKEEEASSTVGVLILKAAAMSLIKHPLVNGSYREGRFEMHSRINVGFAVPTDRGLLVPTIFDADRLTIDEVAREAKRLITRARDGSITPNELSGVTFTVSNLGVFDVEAFTAVINPPQAAILAVGRISKRPVVGHDESIVPRRQMTITLGCDHRILQGADGAAFLQDLKEVLENPSAL